MADYIANPTLANPAFQALLDIVDGLQGYDLEMMGSSAYHQLTDQAQQVEDNIGIPMAVFLHVISSVSKAMLADRLENSSIEAAHTAASIDELAEIYRKDLRHFADDPRPLPH